MSRRLSSQKASNAESGSIPWRHDDLNVNAHPPDVYFGDNMVSLRQDDKVYVPCYAISYPDPVNITVAHDTSVVAGKICMYYFIYFYSVTISMISVIYGKRHTKESFFFHLFPGETASRPSSNQLVVKAFINGTGSYKCQVCNALSCQQKSIEVQQEGITWWLHTMGKLSATMASVRLIQQFPTQRA